MVRFTSERLGSNRFSPAMFEFSNIIEELNLLDLPLEGGLFTCLAIQTHPLCLALIGF